MYWEDTSWKWLSTPSAEKRSTILRRFSMTAEPSSISVHWIAAWARTFIRSPQIMSRLKACQIMSWFRLTEDEKQKDFELALSLATNHRELFEVAHEYEFVDFQKAIQHVSSPGKTGIVLLKSPV